MTEFREGWRGGKARKVVWNSSRLEEGFETHAKSLLPVTLCVQLRGGRHVDGSSTSKTGPSVGKLRDHHAWRVEEQILTTKATTGAQSRDRAARPERGRTAGCRRQLGWYNRYGFQFSNCKWRSWQYISYFLSSDLKLLWGFLTIKLDFSQFQPNQAATGREHG